jgi:hypothetical protein
MNWLPDDHTNVQGGAPAADAAAGGSAPSEDGAAGGGAASEDVTAGGPPDRAGTRPDPSTAALLAGLIALVAGPLLTADPTRRYLVLAAAVTALVLGAIGVWTALRGPGRLDYATAALVTGGVSLYLWIGYVSDPPQGGT